MGRSVGRRGLAAGGLILALAVSAPAEEDVHSVALGAASPRVAAEARRLRSAGLALWLERSRRLMRVSDALRSAAAPLCDGRDDERSPVLGVVAAARDDLAPAFQTTAARDLGVGEGVRVLHVEPGLAAARAGLRTGDVILRLDGTELRSVAGLGLAHPDAPDARLQMEVVREGVPRALRIPVHPGCSSAAFLLQDDGINAYMAKGRIFATSGLLGFVADDHELAAIMAHEIAHHVLGAGGTPADEADADALGLALAAAAGFDVARAPAFWQRFALGAAFALDASHPASLLRSRTQEAVAGRIQALRASGSPLPPLSADLARWPVPPLPKEASTPSHPEPWIARAADALLADSGRVLAVSDRLRRAGAPLCAGSLAPLLGFHAATRPLRPPSSPVLEALYQRSDVGPRPTVTLVDPDSPAARAGVSPGDRVLRVNGRRIRDERQLASAIRKAAETPPELVLERAGTHRTVTLALEPACAFTVVLAPMQQRTSFRTDLGQAAISRGLLALARDDDELALWIAHELGHRMLAGGQGPRPRAEIAGEELSADRFALAMARRAGFDVSKAPALYERLALEKPELVLPDPGDLGHPGHLGDSEPPIHGRLAERILALRERAAP